MRIWIAVIFFCIGVAAGIEFWQQQQANQYISGFHDGLDFAIKAMK